MVNDNDNSGLIVKTRFGPYTGDESYQTIDGCWWSKWDGVVRTGQELRELYK